MKDTNIHKGHRARMRRKFRQNGLDALDDHEVLELLLYYGIPYKNTNETAHKLLNSFRTLSGVFDADYEELLRLDGIGENSATLLTLIPELARRYNIDKAKPCDIFGNNESIGEYLVNHYIGKSKEHVEVLFFDAKMHMIGHETLHEGALTSSDINCEKLAEILFYNRAANFILAHNHPGGNAEPSNEDLLITRKIYNIMTPLNRYLLEHFIIADGKYNGILRESLRDLYTN